MATQLSKSIKLLIISLQGTSNAWAPIGNKGNDYFMHFLKPYIGLGFHPLPSMGLARNLTLVTFLQADVSVKAMRKTSQGVLVTLEFGQHTGCKINKYMRPNRIVSGLTGPSYIYRTPMVYHSLKFENLNVRRLKFHDVFHCAPLYSSTALQLRYACGVDFGKNETRSVWFLLFLS